MFLKSVPKKGQKLENVRTETSEYKPQKKEKKTEPPIGSFEHNLQTGNQGL